MGRMKDTAKRQPEPIIPDDILKGVTDALKPLDRVASEMEAKWGAGRLPRLVGVELAARFGRARDALNDAIRANDPAEVERKAAALVRGWQALDQAATDAGAEQMPSTTWSLTHNGITYTVVRNSYDADKVAKMDPEPGRVVTIAELLTAWQWHNDRTNGMIEAVKKQWPAATVKRFDETQGDELTF